MIQVNPSFQTTPFVAALGSRLSTLPADLREHFEARASSRYRGTMSRVWRRSGWRGLVSRPFLSLAALTETLFPETGEHVPFELENRVVDLPDGRRGMTWTRDFRFPSKRRRFDAVMVFEPRRGSITDWLGRRGHLEVELFADVRDGAVVLRSGRQRLKLGRLRLRLPMWIVGRADVREWQVAPGRLGIEVRISNPILGEFFGYRGEFRQVGDGPGRTAA